MATTTDTASSSSNTPNTFIDQVLSAKEVTRRRLHCKCTKCFEAIDDLIFRLTQLQPDVPLTKETAATLTASTVVTPIASCPTGATVVGNSVVIPTISGGLPELASNAVLVVDTAAGKPQKFSFKRLKTEDGEDEDVITVYSDDQPDEDIFESRKRSKPKPKPKKKIPKKKPPKMPSTDTNIGGGGITIISLNCSEPGCKVVTEDKSQLRAHLLRKHGIKGRLCAVAGCDEMVKSSQLTQHNATKHADLLQADPNTNPTPWSCRYCGHSYHRYKGLSSHIYYFHERGTFACAFEGCSFTSPECRARVRKHQLSHNNFTYKCLWPGCSKAFKKNKVLKCHLRVHTGEKPFYCEICDQSFTQKSSLAVHLKTGAHRRNCETLGLPVD